MESILTSINALKEKLLKVSIILMRQWVLIRRLFLLKIKYLVVWKPNTVMEYVVMEILGDILLKHICVAGKIVRAIAHPS